MKNVDSFFSKIFQQLTIKRQISREFLPAYKNPKNRDKTKCSGPINSPDHDREFFKVESFENHILEYF